MTPRPVLHQLRAGVVLVLLVLAAGCHQPTADERFARGREFAKQSLLNEAIIEFRAAVLLDPKRGDIRLELADAYVRQGNLRDALGESVRAADLLPTDVTAQLRAGSLLLLARSFEDVKARANAVLAIHPDHPEALILLGNSYAGLLDFDAALAEYQQAVTINPDDGFAYLSMGAIQTVRGNHKEAEAAFRKALQLAPKSTKVRGAFANFLWAQGRVKETEETLKEALAIDPDGILSNRALAVFYLVSNRATEAAPYFEKIAAVAKTSDALLAVADYYAAIRRFDAASKILQDLVSRPDARAAAQVRLAVIDVRNNLMGEAMSKLDEILAEKPNEMTARLVKAHLLNRKGQTDEAVAIASSIVRDEPASTSAESAFLLLGSIHSIAERREDAIQAYKEVLKRQPKSLAANVALSWLELSTGSVEAARNYAQAALDIRPGNALALAMRTRIHLAENEVPAARSTIAPLARAFPEVPMVLNLAGAVLWAEGKVDLARTTFLKTLSVSPTDVEATTALVRMDLAAGRSQDALKRIDDGLAGARNNPDFLVLAARAYGSAGQAEKAAEFLERAIEIAPGRLAAYDLLGAYYVSRGRLDLAEKQFGEIVRRNPSSIGALTMLGMILEVRGRPDEGERQYRAALALSRPAPVAANNLAWMLVTSGRNLDEALQFAQAAYRDLPSEPKIADTLGWIYFTKGMFERALPYFQAAVKKSPNAPGLRFHLGLTYERLSDFRRARQELSRALELKPDFEGADEARKLLKSMPR